jgi:hypothetical protein
VQFSVEAAREKALAQLAVAAPVQVEAEPSVQVSYKLMPAVTEGISMLASVWMVSNPATGDVYQEFRKDPVRLPTTLTVPARLVDPQGRLRVTYVNVPDVQSGAVSSVSVLDKDIAVLYRVGDFTPNFLRGLVLVSLQLMFLAAVGLTAGTFLSFAVACLVALTVLPFGMAQGFIQGAVTTSSHVNSVLQYPGGAAIFVLRLLMPDFGVTSAGSFLVNGSLISWTHLGVAAVQTIAVRGLLLLGAACVIFHRRELARVQV